MYFASLFPSILRIFKIHVSRFQSAIFTLQISYTQKGFFLNLFTYFCQLLLAIFTVKTKLKIVKDLQLKHYNDLLSANIESLKKHWVI